MEVRKPSPCGTPLSSFLGCLLRSYPFTVFTPTVTWATEKSENWCQPTELLVVIPQSPRLLEDSFQGKCEIPMKPLGFFLTYIMCMIEKYRNSLLSTENQGNFIYLSTCLRFIHSFIQQIFIKFSSMPDIVPSTENVANKVPMIIELAF